MASYSVYVSTYTTVRPALVRQWHPILAAVSATQATFGLAKAKALLIAAASTTGVASMLKMVVKPFMVATATSAGAVSSNTRVGNRTLSAGVSTVVNMIVRYMAP